jgi:murein DD-endopeptidase MepM/ murein hydrolase activator NlpD
MNFIQLNKYIGAFFLLSWAPVVRAADVIPTKVLPIKCMDTIQCPGVINVGAYEDLDMPASFLYPEWSNEYVHKYSNVLFPDSLVINMANCCMPTPSTKITDIFGYRPRRRRMHYGLDLKVEIGDTIRAAFDGKVRVSDYEKSGYGYYLVVRHPNGLETCYAHLSKKLVKENDVVHAGEPIALGGNSGRSTGSHLHFEVMILGKAINPALLFDFQHQRLVTDNYVFHNKQLENERTYYKVRSGDTLSKIALKNDTTISTLCKLNGMSTRSILRIGQTLRIN